MTTRGAISNNHVEKSSTATTQILQWKYVLQRYPVNSEATSIKNNTSLQNINRENRRYEYVEFGNGRVFGKKKNCSTRLTYLATYIYWIVYRCSYCFCICDEYDKYSTERTINLRVAMSNTAGNKYRLLSELKHVSNLVLELLQGCVSLSTTESSIYKYKKGNSFRLDKQILVLCVGYHLKITQYKTRTTIRMKTTMCLLGKNEVLIQLI